MSGFGNANAKFAQPNGGDVESPCVSLCKLNSEDTCVGCFRTTAEITAWRSLNNDQKREVIALARARAAQDSSSARGV